VILATFPLLFILSFLTPRSWHNLYVRITCRILMHSVFLFPKMKGIQPEKLPCPAIYVANHVSFFDLFICGSVLPGNPRGLEMKSHFNKPVYGWFITRFGQIPIEPGNRTSVRRSLEEAAQILKKGIRSILVMPEGTRTRTGEIGHFKHGAFFLSKISGIPVVPVVFRGLAARNHGGSYLIRPGFFEVVLLDPVDPENFENDTLLAEHVRSRMISALEGS
jgi:1-acyl-sn-glycerol-3-phosphate acyltransferase